MGFPKRMQGSFCSDQNKVWHWHEKCVYSNWVCHLEGDGSVRKLPDEWNAHGPHSYAFRYSHPQSSLTFVIKSLKLGERWIVHGLAIGVSLGNSCMNLSNGHLKRGSTGRQDGNTGHCHPRLHIIFVFSIWPIQVYWISCAWIYIVKPAQWFSSALQNQHYSAINAWIAKTRLWRNNDVNSVNSVSSRNVLPTLICSHRSSTASVPSGGNNQQPSSNSPPRPEPGSGPGPLPQRPPIFDDPISADDPALG